jgi:Flp pilus assembly pilin Flp
VRSQVAIASRCPFVSTLRMSRFRAGNVVEYALLVVLVGLGAIAAMTNLASGISDAFSNAVAQLTTT